MPCPLEGTCEPERELPIGVVYFSREQLNLLLKQPCDLFSFELLTLAPYMVALKIRQLEVDEESRICSPGVIYDSIRQRLRDTESKHG